LAWAVLPCYALDPSRKLSQYHKANWQVEAGLPHSYVTAIHEAPDGYLLVGTDEGMARFDGIRFRPPDSDPSLRLSQRWISALLSGGDGSLWIGTFEGLLFRLREGRLLEQYNAGGSVFDLLQGGGGEIWASTRTGVYRAAAGRLTRVEGLRNPSETAWNVLARDSSGAIYVVTADGLFRFERGVVTRELTSGMEGDLLTVSTDRRGTVWVGTARGLYQFKAVRGSKQLTAHAGVPGPVVSILEDRDGVIWAGTWGRGVYRITSKAVDGWSSQSGLPDDFIRTLWEDREGNLWIGSRSGGLSRWKDTRIVPFGTPEGLAGNFASTVARAQDGTLWLGTWRGGLYRLREGSFESQPTPLPTLYFTVRALAIGLQGQVWTGNWEGLHRFDGRRHDHFAQQPDSPYRHVSAILCARDGSLWVGTVGHGLFRFPQAQPDRQAAVHLLPDAGITSLLEDSRGRIWVGTNSGLRIVAGAASEPAPVEGLPREQIESVSEDSEGRIWAPTAGSGLLLVAGERRMVLGSPQGIPGHPLYRILDDGAGSLWVSSARGILQLRTSEVRELLAGRLRRLEVFTHDLDDGMRTVECHGLSQPSGARHADGSLWFATAKGFVKIEAAGRSTVPPPKALIEEVSVDGTVLPANSEISLGPGTRNIEIRFTALRFAAPSQSQFRYRIGGFDPEWVGSTERSARYNSVPPGLHRFQVQARDPWGAWSEPAQLGIRQLPRFYQTSWFLGTLFVAGLATCAAAYRWRVYALKGRYKAVLEERTRIAREWHDTLVAGFSAISLQLEAALAKLGDQPERSAAILDVTRKMVHHYRAEARRVIWDLRDNRPEGERLTEAVRSALERTIQGREMKGSVAVTGQEEPLPKELEHDVLRICQEAFANALRHGQPSCIDVRIEYARGSLRATVRDDGKGFDVGALGPEPTGHFGLTVMKERARRYGGRLRLESSPGNGTIVEATIPRRGVTGG
jgi:signal transduction histidine kinase